MWEGQLPVKGILPIPRIRLEKGGVFASGKLLGGVSEKGSFLIYARKKIADKGFTSLRKKGGPLPS